MWNSIRLRLAAGLLLAVLLAAGVAACGQGAGGNDQQADTAAQSATAAAVDATGDGDVAGERGAAGDAASAAGGVDATDDADAEEKEAPVGDAGPVLVVLDPANGDGLIQVRVDLGRDLEQPAVPQREGYRFVGWFPTDGGGTDSGVDSPAGERDAWDFGRDTVDGDLRLTAQWVAGSYALTYDGNDHNEGALPPAVGAEFGDSLEIAAPEGLFRDEYRFSGWNTDPAGEGDSYAPGATVSMPAEDIVLYAQWEAIQYQLRYLGGAADAGDPPTSRQGPRDAVVNVADAGSLSRIGYRFSGWDSEPDGTGVRFEPGDSLVMPSGGFDLHARWEPKEHVVSFRSRLPVAESMRVVRYDDRIVAPEVEVPIGYTLAGWLVAGVRQRYWDFPNDTITDDLVLQADWRVDLVPVDGGSFRREADSPVMTTVSDFAIGRYMVTQRQYVEITGRENPSYFTRLDAAGRPVDQVSWYDAIVFCNMASLHEGLDPVYSLNGSRNPADWGEVPDSDDPVWSTIAADWSAAGYRLPTEAEWQWAAMGGRDKPAQQFAGDDGSGADVGDYAWYRDNAGETLPGGEEHTAFGTHPVGSLLPNELGIYDMSGNLREWVWDWFQAYPDETLADPRGPDSGQVKAVRGGSWSNHGVNLTPAFRYIRSPGYRNYLYGFRVARGSSTR